MEGGNIGRGGRREHREGWKEGTEGGVEGGDRGRGGRREQRRGNIGRVGGRLWGFKILNCHNVAIIFAGHN